MPFPLNNFWSQILRYSAAVAVARYNILDSYSTTQVLFADSAANGKILRVAI